jgi:sensor histidine kinase YesM
MALALFLNKETDFSDNKLLDFYFPMIYIWLALSIGRGLLNYLSHFSDSLIKQKDVELSKLKQVNAEAEVRLLQSQINPHFLYNALNSIASLALVDGEKTQKMSYALSNLFKYSINRKEKRTSTIGDEIKMVQNYLDIEKIRFGDRLQFSIEAGKELEGIEIPLFVIQPLVENAIKHGVSKIEGKGIILLKIKKIEKEIKIIIIDNGPQFSEGLVNGHGLQTVYDLLELSYGEEASLNWQNIPEKNIQITIPL